jgi:hypothetical protein
MTAAGGFGNEREDGLWAERAKGAIVCALGFTIFTTLLAHWRWQVKPNMELPENLVRASDAFDTNRTLADLIALEANLSLKPRTIGGAHKILTGCLAVSRVCSRACTVAIDSVCVCT